MHIVKQERDFVRENDILVITGDGKTLPEDVYNTQQLYRFYDKADLMCIGRSIKIANRAVTHYVDVDADAGKWVIDNLYDNNPHAGRPITHTLGKVDWFQWCWDMDSQMIVSDEVIWHGSSALFAVLIALEMGYNRIILAGCPLDSKGHWYFPEETNGPKWTAETYQSWLEFAQTDEAIEKVRSLSGYTQVMLGDVDIEWIEGKKHAA